MENLDFWQNIVYQAPNFVFAFVAVWTLRQANRELLEYLRDCDCGKETRRNNQESS